MRLSTTVLCITLLAGCGSDDPAERPAEPQAASTDTSADAAAQTGEVQDSPDVQAPQPDGPNICRNAGTDGATASCLTPTQTPEYYAEQASKYFDTLDIEAPPESKPNYAALVVRWEWAPWLLLTGYTAEAMNDTSAILKQFDPSTVPTRDCRGFDTQPFARCYVVFEYEGGLCPIYEEFSFNDAGEMTFIEAWSDLDGLRPMTDPADTWAEAADLPRLSNRVPGLGNATGTIDFESPWMKEAAAEDADVADLAARAENWWAAWSDALAAAPADFFAKGCGW